MVFGVQILAENKNPSGLHTQEIYANLFLQFNAILVRSENEELK